MRVLDERLDAICMLVSRLRYHPCCLQLHVGGSVPGGTGFLMKAIVWLGSTWWLAWVWASQGLF